jgi:DNA-binding CsgD family transcriptional regulator
LKCQYRLDEAAKKQCVARYDNILLTLNLVERLAQGGAADLRGADEIVRLGAAVLGWLDKDSSPRLILGEKLDIQWCNRAAEDLLSRQVGLEARGDVLIATDGAAQAKLKALLQEARHGPASACIEQLQHEGWLVLRCDAVRNGANLVYCLVVGWAGAGSAWRFDHLAESFELTPAEHRVLQELLAGHDADALSARHGVSIETTRSHIKSIYAKVGVKTREGLFARLRGFRA